MKKVIAVLGSMVVSSLLSVPVCADYTGNPKAQKLMDKMVTEHGFKRAEIESYLADASKKQSIIAAMTRPAEKVKPWKDYRKIFMTEKRIKEGVEFWTKNQAALAAAEKKYGVDPSVIVAIIGVETFYGRIKGKYRVIDALSTLSFDYPPRSKFFTGQLEQFFLLSREQKQNPLKLLGSYAGAMGYGQFIPSSYRSFAVDFDNDGFADIWDNTTDAIGSVANYFARHGWVKGGRVIAPMTAEKGFDAAIVNKLKLNNTIAMLKTKGFVGDGSVCASKKAIPLRLNAESGTENYFGLKNFYVITRYNHSHLYAMAVHQLSEAIYDRMPK